MRRTILLAGLMGVAAVSLSAGGRNVSGVYVEARTAEVFTGGCLMASEAETTGREAVLAWNVDAGRVNGVALDGLSIVAAVSGDHNLGIQEMGGEKASSRSTVLVDSRATPAQQTALVAMATRLSHGVLGTIVNVAAAPIEFVNGADDIRVKSEQVDLQVRKEMSHDAGCGAQQWFHPLAALDDATMGLAERHAFKGSDLGTKWSDPNKRSAFFGSFSY